MQTKRRATLKLVGGGLLAAMAGGMAAVYASYARDMAAARARVQASRRMIETACGPVEYGESGAGAPVLVIHGAAGGFDQGLTIGEAGLGTGYRLIAPSRFGYLGAPVPAQASVAAQAEVYACLLDALGIDQVAVIGFSAGGPSALQFALQYPQRTTRLAMLAAISMRPPLTAEEERTESAINRMVGSDFVYWAAIRAAPSKVLALLGVKEPVQRAMAAEERAIIYRVLEEMLPMSPRLPGIAVDQSFEMPVVSLSQITCPVLVIHARDDTLVTIDYGLHTARSIPGAQWVPFETGGHFLGGHYRELQGLVSRFLEGEVVAGTLDGESGSRPHEE